MNHKYNGCTYHRLALLHVIGQLEQVNDCATLADIARFMNVSKPTAMKYLKPMIDNQEICKAEQNYRSNAKKYKFYLFEDIRDEYKSGHYWKAYMLYSNIHFGANYEWR